MRAMSASRRGFLLTTLSVAIAAAATLVAQVRTKQPLKIAFIGSGHQGGALGLQLARAGQEVMFSSRHPETLKDLVGKAGAKHMPAFRLQSPNGAMSSSSPFRTERCHRSLDSVRGR
jgi:hypothetical protein